MAHKNSFNAQTIIKLLIHIEPNGFLLKKKNHVSHRRKSINNDYTMFTKLSHKNLKPTKLWRKLTKIKCSLCLTTI